jgi:hypothetical protein
VLAVYNWPKNGKRCRRLDQYLFNRWDKLMQPSYHPGWRNVNLAATVPGWTRFTSSEDMLRHAAQAVSGRDSRKLDPARHVTGDPGHCCSRQDQCR